MIEGQRFSQYNETFKNLKLASIDEKNTFRPQKIGNKIKLLAGVDEGNYAISVISDDHDIILTSTQLIKVRKVNLPKNKVATIFTLTDEQLLSIFISFAIDLESILARDQQISIIEIYNRYLYWQKLFKIEIETISEEKIKGLLNELYIIDKLMIPKYGIEEAIKGWGGTEGMHKDFAFKDGYWYEAKSIDTGKLTVGISSVEQLESDVVGYLLITQLEKTSPQNSEAVRLYDLVNKINNSIEIDSLQILFMNKIASLGISLEVFSNPDYKANLSRYLIKNINCYEVNNEFPRLTRTQLFNAIGLVRYELIISEINNFKIDFK